MLEASVLKPKMQFKRDLRCSLPFVLSFRSLLAVGKEGCKGSDVLPGTGHFTLLIITNLESKLNRSTCYLGNCGEVSTLFKSQFSHLRNNNNLFNNNVCKMPDT